MKLDTFSNWRPDHKNVGLIWESSKTTRILELSLHNDHYFNNPHYWGYRREDEYHCRSFGFYFFKVFYYSIPKVTE